MTLINMLSAWQWLVVAAIPAVIVLLYFLKLKRQPLEVPSTYLWHKSIEDLHVNSIWQRLRKSILLFLQLLFVAILVLALVRPGWRGTELTGNRFIFLIDNSASMSSTDVQPTRLDEVKRRVADLIEQMASGDVAMIVSFSDSARNEVEFTDSRRQLLRGLEGIKPTNRRTSLGEALRLAAGLANPGRAAFEISDTRVAEPQPATVYIFSDGKFPSVEGFSLGNLEPKFVPIGSKDAPNVGITAFSTRRRDDRPEQLQAFARLENVGTQTVKAQVELYRDDTLADADEVELEAGKSGGVVFELGDLHEGVLRLQTSSGGALPVDDQAWAVIDPPARAKMLLVTPGNDALELAFSTESAAELAEVDIVAPEFLESPEYKSRASDGYYSLAVYDQCQPPALPQCDTLFVGKLPPGDSWRWSDIVEAPQIIDVDTAHPLMQLIDLGDVKFAEGRVLTVPQGGTVLVDSHAGPLFAIAPRGAYEDAVLAADIVGTDDQGQRFANTDWPLRLSFPVFAMNALRYFGGASAAGAATNVQPGQSVTLRSAASPTLEVRTPDGRRTSLARESSDAFSFSGTDELGVYEIAEPNQPLRRFAVNLFDSGESEIASRDDVQIGYVEVAGEATWEGARRELWKALLFVALAVLCLEWYIYNRRVYL
ncbi:MAG: BatA and WFA domain-containing protein [Pirellulales bacterium]